MMRRDAKRNRPQGANVGCHFQKAIGWLVFDADLFDGMGQIILNLPWAVAVVTIGLFEMHRLAVFGCCDVIGTCQQGTHACDGFTLWDGTGRILPSGAQYRPLCRLGS